MGNTPVFAHRLPALAASCLSSVALTLLAVAGTTCSFLEVSAKNGQSLVIPDGSEQEDVSSHDIGVLCDSEYYDKEGDTMWQLSSGFLIVSLTLGSLCTALAWSVSTFLPPSDANWKALSIASSLTAVLQVPVFLLFESKPCSSYDEHNCTVSLGCFLLIASTVFWVAVTLLTQCVDPPLWAVELNAWRVQKRRAASASHQADPYMLPDDNDSMEEVYILQQYSSRSRRSSPWFLRGFRRWMHKRRWAHSPHLPLTATESDSRDDEEAGAAGAGDVPIEQYPEADSYYANSSNSRLLLKVMPNGKLPGDDQKSVATFGDLDDFVKLAEDGPLPPSPSRLLGEHEDERADSVIVQDKTQRSSPQKSTLDEPLGSEDEENPISPVQRGEPQIYTDPKAFSNSDPSGGLIAVQRTSDQSCGSKRCLVLPGESSFDGPGGKIALGIRALTIRVKRDMSLRMKHGKTYAMMDDDSDESSLSSDGEYEEEDNAEEVEERNDQGMTDKSSARLVTKWNSLFSTATPVILPASRTNSSSEEDPEIVYYSSDDALTSISSLEHKPSDAEDDSSTLSGSSVSDSSDSEAQRSARKNIGDREKRFKRRKQRKSRRNLSCGNSVCSRRSLLDTTIDEETVYDLMAFESDEELKKTYPISRTKSAPETVDVTDPDLSSPCCYGSDPYSGYRYEFDESHSRKPSISDSSYVSSESTALRGASSTDETTSSIGEFFNGNNKPEGAALIIDIEEGGSELRKQMRSRSVSIPRRKSGSSSRSFVEERLLTAGIHSPFIAVVSDSDDSSSEASRENHSVHSNISRRARVARLRRLQRETVASKQRRRARTLDPPKNRWQVLSTNSFDLPGNIAVGSEEYGSDEASL